jgi:hypothetical protein
MGNSLYLTKNLKVFLSNPVSSRFRVAPYLEIPSPSDRSFFIKAGAEKGKNNFDVSEFNVDTKLEKISVGSEFI